MLRALAASLLVLGLASSAVCAGWPSDPAQNLSVADNVGDQVLPKVAPTADGGCYISWFDNIANGFDVRIQRLDVLGDEVFPHNGILVADRSFSWVMNYGLDVDASGNAIIAFRDDRFGGEQITAAKVAPDGTLVWGTTGVQLTSTTDFVASPKIAGTSDGGTVVAWTQESDAHLQKLDAGGNPIWNPEIVFTPGTGSYTVCDLHDSSLNVIVSFAHMIGSFPSPSHLLAQKLGANGNLLWDTGHVAVFDGGSLQFGYFPPFVPDGTGGAVFFWYDTMTMQLQSYAQHILADGTEAFGHNGSPVSTNSARIRVSPWASFNPTTGETYVFWREQNSGQSMDGLYGQKFDASGNRQWSDQGIGYIPVGDDYIDLVRCLTSGNGAFAFWLRDPGGGQDRLYGMHVDPAGAVDIETFNVASTPGGKSRLSIAKGVSGYAILAWSDSRNDEGDILAQNVNPDGTLGDPVTGTGDLPEVHRLFLSAPWPNPTSSVAHFDYGLSGNGNVELAIYDIRGRLIRRLVGDRELTQRGLWDGLDDSGSGVETGVYFLQLRNGKGSETEKIIVTR